jgi:hypothetical protein
VTDVTDVTANSGAERDADVLDILAQAEDLGIEVALLPDPKLGKLDPSLWKERNGYSPEREEDR